MKVYKATYNMKCQNLTYEVGKTYSINKLELCKHGFHFCENPIDTLNYYDYKKDFKLLECEVLGETRYGLVKGITNKLKVIRVIPDNEVKELLNEYFDNHKYDDKGNLICVKYPNGDIYEWKYKYDNKGKLIWEKYPNGDIYEYDDKGNLIWKKNTNGRIFEWEYKYDDNGNIIWEKYPDGDIFEWEYKYDDNGNIIWEKDSDGDIYKWEYDDKGNVIEEIKNGESQYKITIE